MVYVGRTGCASEQGGMRGWMDLKKVWLGEGKMRFEQYLLVLVSFVHLDIEVLS